MFILILNFCLFQEKVSFPGSTSNSAQEQSVTYPSQSIFFQNGTMSLWSW